jgi:hypothetical protein
MLITASNWPKSQMKTRHKQSKNSNRRHRRQNNAGQKSPDEYPSSRNFYHQQHPSNLLHAQDKEITMLSWNIWVLYNQAWCLVWEMSSTRPRKSQWVEARMPIHSLETVSGLFKAWIKSIENISIANRVIHTCYDNSLTASEHKTNSRDVNITENLACARKRSCWTKHTIQQFKNRVNRST